MGGWSDEAPRGRGTRASFGETPRGRGTGATDEGRGGDRGTKSSFDETLRGKGDEEDARRGAAGGELEEPRRGKGGGKGAGRASSPGNGPPRATAPGPGPRTPTRTSSPRQSPKPSRKAPKESQENDPDALLKKLTLQFAKATKAGDILGIVESDKSESMNHFHLAAAFTTLAKLKASFTPELQESAAVTRLVKRLQELMDQNSLPPSQSASIFWSLATLGDQGKRFHELLPALVRCISVKTGLELRHISTSIWASAKLPLQDEDLEELTAALAPLVEKEAANFNIQAVNNIIWATGRLRTRAPKLLELQSLLTRLAIGKAAEFRGVDLAQLLWTIGQLKTDAPELLKALVPVQQQVLKLKGRMEESELRTCVEAIVTLKEEAPDLLLLLPELFAEVYRPKNTFKTALISEILRAGALLLDEAPNLVSEEVPELLKLMNRRVDLAMPRDLAISIWALAKMGLAAVYRGPLSVLLKRAAALAPETKLVSMASACQGVALGNMGGAELFKAVAAEVPRAAAESSELDKKRFLPTIAWAFAKREILNEELLEVIALQLADHLPGVEDWNLCALAWAYDELGVSARFEVFLAKVWDELRKRNLDTSKVFVSQFGLDEWNRAIAPK